MASLPDSIGDLGLNTDFNELRLDRNVLQDLPSTMANLTKMGYVSAANNPFNRLKGHKLGAILKSMHPSKQFDLAYSSSPA